MTVSRATFNEVRAKLVDAGYPHAIHDEVLDMYGIALEPEPEDASAAYEKDALRHSQYCVWSLCDSDYLEGHCVHAAKDHDTDGHCLLCKCPQYGGREVRHVEAK